MKEEKMRVSLWVRKEDLKPGMVVMNERTGQIGEVADRTSAPWCVVVHVQQKGRRTFDALWRVTDLVVERVVGEQ